MDPAAFCIHGSHVWLHTTAALLVKHVLLPLSAVPFFCEPQNATTAEAARRRSRSDVTVSWAGLTSVSGSDTASACLTACLRLVWRHEQKRDLRFKWLGVVAAQALFLSPHPSLSALPLQGHAVWTQHGIPLTEYYLLPISFLRKGEQHEAFPRTVLSLPRATMPTLQALACSGGTAGCSRMAGYDMRVGTATARIPPSDSECTRLRFIGTPRLVNYYPMHTYLQQCRGAAEFAPACPQWPLFPSEPVHATVHALYTAGLTRAGWQFAPVSSSSLTIMPPDLSPLPPPSPRPAQGRLLHNAVCVVGGVRDFPRSAERLRRYLFDPIGADAFVLLNYEHRYDIARATRAARVLPLAGLSLIPNGDIRGAFHRQASAKTRAFVARLAREPNVGNSLQPIVGDSPGGIMYQLRLLDMCLDQLQAAEALYNKTYDWVVYVRSDTVLFGAHPPLEELAGGRIWVPQGNDYSGLSDRFAVIPRTVATTYLGRWRAILNGAFMDYFQNNLNSEMFLQRCLQHAGITVARYPPLVGLGGCGANTCLSSAEGSLAGYHLRRPYEALAPIITVSLLQGGWRWPDCKTGRCDELLPPQSL